MGGWARIWVVLTVAVSAFAGWVYVDNVGDATRQANDAYKTALDGYDDCRQHPSGPLAASDPLSRFLKDACDYAAQPRNQFAAQQERQQDAAIAAEKQKAAGLAVSTVAWVSGTIGTLFWAIGWIRRGFRKRTSP